MTKRYGLSDDQVAKLRAILKDEQQKTYVQGWFALTQRSLNQNETLRDDETTRVSGILSPEQQKKYQDDIKQMQLPQSQPPGGFPPPPPGLRGGVPPAV